MPSACVYMLIALVICMYIFYSSFMFTFVVVVQMQMFLSVYYLGLFAINIFIHTACCFIYLFQLSLFFCFFYSLFLKHWEQYNSQIYIYRMVTVPVCGQDQSSPIPTFPFFVNIRTHQNTKQKGALLYDKSLIHIGAKDNKQLFC